MNILKYNIYIIKQYSKDYYRIPKNPAHQNHINFNLKSLPDPGNGVRDSKLKWPRVGNKIVIPFIIDPFSSYSRIQIDKVYAAMRHISERTCINFRWKSNEKDYLLIYSGKWCTSYVGRVGGEQRVSLQKDETCGNHIGMIVHELVHALGFLHMQSHADRDNYISVIKENISPGEQFQFDKVNSMKATNFGTPYDYFSIMHYGTHAFSKNGRPTIVTKIGKFNQFIGQTNKLSLGDLVRIRMMYNCKCLEASYRNC